MKKYLSVILSLLLILAIMPNIPANAMTPQDGANWALAQVGRWIDTDGAYGAQCVDLIVEYCRTNFGWNPQGSGNAEAYRTVKLPSSSWQRIKNTPEFIPQPGDIAIWNPAASNGYCGHVAIIVSANINTFESVDQNLKGSTNGSAAQKTTHNYNNFWGVIRPPFSSQPHTHSYTTYVYDWLEHPHYRCYKCSCGEVKENRAETSYNENCSECLGANASKNAPVNDGLYTLKNASSGYMMNIYAGKDANGTNVTTWQFDGTTDQRIYIQNAGNGRYLLKFNASSSGRVIDVNRGESLTASIDDGDKIDIWAANDPGAQYFWINDAGNNAYTIELVSKPDHVISATGASAAATNGAQLELKRYTGADYQKWYLCDTSGNVIGSCDHGSTNKVNASTSYTEKDGSSHNSVVKYDLACSKCGEITKSGLSEEKAEAHSLRDGKCTKCGYKEATESVCEHKSTYQSEAEFKSANKIDEYNHVVSQTYDMICADCKKVVEANISTEKTEPHSFADSKCSVCNYENDKEEPCAHKNTYQSGIKSSDVSVKNDTHHTITETYDVYCSDCNDVVKADLEGVRTEKHEFNGNMCVSCGYKKAGNDKVYTDITDTELMQTVNALSNYGIINGYDDGSFRPYNNITRAEFSKIICVAGMFDTTGVTENNFYDVDGTHWARSYIYTAKRLGIINGISQVAFAPEANITYEQAIKMIVASMGYGDEAMRKGGYPQGYITIANELGILNGISYVQTDYATRANIARIIYGAMDAPCYELTEYNGNVVRSSVATSLKELHER